VGIQVYKLFFQTINLEMSEYKKNVTHTFISGKLSSTLIIPIDTARKYGLDRRVNVVVEEQEDGIFIKKLNL
jgi:hypothetical protein